MTTTTRVIIAATLANLAVLTLIFVTRAQITEVLRLALHGVAIGLMAGAFALLRRP